MWFLFLSREGIQKFKDKDLYIHDATTLRLLELPSDKRLSKVDHLTNYVIIYILVNKHKDYENRTRRRMVRLSH